VRGWTPNGRAGWVILALTIVAAALLVAVLIALAVLAWG
jgi:hypothetical protein